MLASKLWPEPSIVTTIGHWRSGFQFLGKATWYFVETVVAVFKCGLESVGCAPETTPATKARTASTIEVSVFIFYHWKIVIHPTTQRPVAYFPPHPRPLSPRRGEGREITGLG